VTLASTRNNLPELLLLIEAMDEHLDYYEHMEKPPEDT